MFDPAASIHVGGPGACVTVNVAPAIVIVPALSAPVVLAATL
jgi:hypothetical protein